MKLHLNSLKPLLKNSLQFIPTPFLCRSCNLPCWEGICSPCLNSIILNDILLPSPSSELIAIAPSLYAFQNTYTLIRLWKEHRGSLLRLKLFQISPVLKENLLAINFDFIIPIPQSKMRSHLREHSSAFEVTHFFSNQLKIPVLELISLHEQNPTRFASLTAWDRAYAPNPFQISSRLFKEDLLYSEKLEKSILKRQEIKLLLVDDLITSGSTLIKAAETIHTFLPRSKIYGASLGYRPKKVS